MNSFICVRFAKRYEEEKNTDFLSQVLSTVVYDVDDIWHVYFGIFNGKSPQDGTVWFSLLLNQKLRVVKPSLSQETDNADEIYKISITEEAASLVLQQVTEDVKNKLTFSTRIWLTSALLRTFTYFISNVFDETKETIPVFHVAKILKIAGVLPQDLDTRSMTMSKLRKMVSERV